MLSCNSYLPTKPTHARSKQQSKDGLEQGSPGSHHSMAVLQMQDASCVYLRLGFLICQRGIRLLVGHIVKKVKNYIIRTGKQKDDSQNPQKKVRTRPNKRLGLVGCAYDPRAGEMVKEARWLASLPTC